MAYRLEVWNGANTERLAHCTSLLVADRRQVLGGEETLKAVITPTDPALARMSNGAVLRLQEEGSATNFSLWRLAAVEKTAEEDGREVVEITADALWMDAKHGMVSQVQADGRREYTFGLPSKTPLVFIRDYILPACRATGISFQLGTVEVSAPVDLDFENTSPLAALRLLEAALEAEGGGEVQFRLSSDGTRYFVDLLQRVGRANGGAELRHEFNVRGLNLTEDYSDVATRVYATGGAGLYLGDARWTVQAVNGSAVTFDRNPVFEDGAFTDPDGAAPLWLRVTGKASYPITGSTKATGVVSVSTAGRPALAPGDVAYFATDEAGTPLDYLESPSARGAAATGYGVRSAAVAADDIPFATNLLANGNLTTWSGGLPSQWSAVGSPTVIQDDAAIYAQHGGSSARVVAGAADVGLISAPFAITSRSQQAYTGLYVGLTVKTGKVRVELRHSNGRVYPTSQANVSQGLNTYLEIRSSGPVHAEPLPAGTAQLAIVAHGGAAEFWLDAAMVTPMEGETPEFVEHSGAWELWGWAADELARLSRPRMEISVEVPNLYQADPTRFRFTQILLGDDVTVWHPRVTSQTARVVELMERVTHAETMEVTLASSAFTRLHDPLRPRRDGRRRSRGRIVAPPASGRPQVLSYGHQANRETGLVFVNALGSETTATLQLHTKTAMADPYPTTPAATIVGRSGTFPGISYTGSSALYYRITPLDGSGVAGESVEDSFARPEIAPVLEYWIALDPTYKDRVDVTVRFSSPLGEECTIEFRNTNSATAPLWRWTSVSGGAVVKYAPSGSTVGPEAEFFAEGQPNTWRLNDLPLAPDTSSGRQVRPVSKSGVPGAWVTIVMPPAEQAVMQGVDLVWEEAADVLRLSGTGGPFIASAVLEVSPDGFATTPSTAAARLAVVPGQRVTATWPLAQLTRGKVYTGRVLPYNGALSAGLPTGLVGLPAYDTEEIPASETGGPEKPRAWIEWAGSSPVKETVQLQGALGTGATGPLTWRYRVDDELTGGGAWQAPGGALPYVLMVTRSPRRRKWITLEVTDAAGRSAQSDPWPVEPYLIRDTTTAGQGGRSGREGDERSGLGGVPGRITSRVAIEDELGGQVLLNPSNRRMGMSLLGPTGTPSGDIEDGGNRGRAGLALTGLVNIGVPRGFAVAEVDAISSGDGRLRGDVTMSGVSAYPVDTGDAVGALSDGPTVTQGATRANTGLAADGKVQIGVPRVRAVAELPALSSTDGRILDTAAVSGKPTVFPVASDDPVTTLSDGPAVAAGAGRANTGLASDGKVQVTVPRTWALGEVPAISTTDGKLRGDITMSGSTALPLDTGDPVAALSDGAAVTTGATRANTALDANSRLTDQRRLNTVVSANFGSVQSAVPFSWVWHSASGTWTVTMAAHTLKLGFGSVSYNAASASMNPSTTYYCWLDDEGLAGGSRPLQFSTNIQDAVLNGRYYVGKVTTPDSMGNGGTVGGGGGARV